MPTHGQSHMHLHLSVRCLYLCMWWYADLPTSLLLRIISIINHTLIRFWLHKDNSLLNRPGFCELCDRWKIDNINDGIYRDVYDGKIWTDFQFYNGNPFLSEPFTYGLMLNVDWFKPQVTSTVKWVPLRRWSWGTVQRWSLQRWSGYHFDGDVGVHFDGTVDGEVCTTSTVKLR